MQRKLWLLGSVAVLALITMGYSLYRIAASPPAAAQGLYGSALDTPLMVEGVTLTQADGARVALEDYRGDLLLVFFGFANCPDVCPLTMARLAKIYEDLGEPEDLRVVMITVDPVNDTPERVQQYAGAFHSSFVGLSGTNSDIANAAKTFYIAYRDIGDNQFIHSDAVALLDRQGRLRLVYGQDKVMHLESDLRNILAAHSW